MTDQTPQKTILITGCSSGIGLDSARRFHEKGWLVLATCRKEDDCQTLRAEGLTSFRLDYEDADSIQSGFDEAMRVSGGRINVLFNNGAYAIPAALEDVPTAALRQIFEANFFGWHSLTRLVLPVMFRQGHGRIIQNSSVLGFAAMRMRGAYNATKFAIEGLTDTMRLELAGSGVEMILVEPGPIRTRIRENGYINFKHWITWQGTRLEQVYETALIPRLSAVNPPRDPFELMPDAVTDAVFHAATAKRPKLRYRITMATKLMALIKRITTSRGFDRVTKHY